MNEVLLYGPIYDHSISEFIKSIQEVEGDAITLRINSNGGSVETGWGAVARFMEFPGIKTVKVDGKAYSMGAYFCLYTEQAECLDVSRFMLHRGGYDEWFENSQYFTEAHATNLSAINKSLREAMEAKLDIPKFEQIAKCTLDEFFSTDGVIDVYLTANQAKQIGLVSKIVKITPEKQSRINARMGLIAAQYTGAEPPVVEEIVTDEQQTNKVKAMTLAELQASHPAIYAEAFNAGVAQERDRVGAWAVYMDVNPKAVKEGIESGNALSATATAEFARQAFAGGQLQSLNNEGQETPVPAAGAAPPAPPKENTEVSAFQETLNAKLGIKTQNK